MAMDRTATLLLIPLIMAIIVIIALIAAIVWMKGDYEIKDREINKFRAEAESAKMNFAREQLARQSLSRFIAGREDAAADVLRSRFLQGGPEDKELEEYKLSSPEARQKFEALTDVYKQIFQERLNALQAAIRAVKSEESVREDLAKEREAYTQVKSDLEAEKQALMEERSRIQSEYEKFKLEAAALQAQLTKMLDDLRLAKEEERKKFEMEIAALYSKISELEERIRVIVFKPPLELMSCDPDGEIILADNRLGITWIDLQRRDGLRVGQVFTVFRYIKGGRRKIKGEVEVKIVNEDKPSQAAIIECREPEDDPMVKGDLIISPFFDKKKVRVFVFAGELVNPLYSRREVERKIEEAGGKVAREVTVETDFLIAGRGAEETEEYSKAIELGVVIMREEELFTYIGR